MTEALVGAQLASGLSSGVRSHMAGKLKNMRDKLGHQIRKNLIKGDTWYLIDARWFAQLEKYLGLRAEGGKGVSSASEEALDPQTNPGPIDNGPLFKDSEEPGEIRKHMVDELDYKLVPEDAWQMLVGEFGVTEGQTAVARPVIEVGSCVKHTKVEVYKIELLLAENSRVDDTIKHKFSKADTLEIVDRVMRQKFQVSDNVETRLWNLCSPNTYERLANLDLTVQDAALYSGQQVIIEQKNSDGSWPRQRKDVLQASDKRLTNSGVDSTSSVPQQTSNAGAFNTVTRKLYDSYSGNSGGIDRGQPGLGGVSNCGSSYDRAQPGLCGLSNLGNTCFMNSIIQGLSNTPPITEYFANDNYIEDINEENPLGMKGEIARSFGELIKSMWSGRYSYVVPRNFKMAVGRFAPQFSGYQQQDSQELLTFLLDGLHEDLNRIKKKPYIEIKDSADRLDEDVASEAWAAYKKRNDSVILDIFHGLLKSTVVCPECPKISVTFDPFCYLSLPLPVRKDRQIEVFLMFMDPSKCPTQYKVICPKDGCMRDLCDSLSRLSGVPSNNMIVTDVYNHRFHKIFDPDEGLNQILERDDIFVYEVPTTDPEHPDITISRIYLREKKSNASYSPSNLFGQPMLIGLPKHNLTYDVLYSHVLKALSRFVTPPTEDNIWWKSAVKNSNTLKNVNSSNIGASNLDDSGASEDSSSHSDGGGVSVSPGAAVGNSMPVIGNDTMEDNEDQSMEEDDDNRGPPKLFMLNIVNSYGNAVVENLVNDGHSLKITSKHYLSVDWSPRSRQLFYNEKAAEDAAQDESYYVKPSQKKPVVSLSECLELYTNKEKLGEDDAWYCPSCKKHQQATKKFDLWSLPCVLVISLKRFSYNRYWRDKLDSHVDFPIRGLDMAPYIINKNHGTAIYDLIAVSNHYGGMGGGHYTAYAKNKDDERWYYFDDSSVTASSEDAVCTKAAYVLFYQRRDLSSMLPPNNPTAICNGNRVNSTISTTVNGNDAKDEDLMDIN